jgi:glycosyltransferase involved in cell wall biosynthesis
VHLKKLLIITYYWPPSGGGGVQRWLKFSKYLRDFNWEPIIYTPENPDFELQDESLLADVPKGIKVIKRPIWEPYAIYRRFLGKKAVQKQGVVADDKGSFLARLSIWLRGNYFIPDSRVFWVRPSVAYLTRLLKKEKIDAIVTTGPPHSIHLIGLELKKRFPIKWVADFRDPWSNWDVLDQLKLSKKSRNSHVRLEKHVLENADEVITVSPGLKKDLEILGATDVELITNGWDLELDGTSGYPNKFQIAHVGLLNRGRNPEALWEVLQELADENIEFKENLVVSLSGTIEEDVLKSIENYSHVHEKMVNRGYLPHQEVTKVYQNSALLLLLINDTNNARWILPGKMYEYMAYNKPILAFGSPESDASSILEEAGFMGCLAYAQKDIIKDIVLREYNAFLSGAEQESNPNVYKYHRKELTKSLAACLDEL